MPYRGFNGRKRGTMQKLDTTYKEATLPFFSGFYNTYAGEYICSLDESEQDYITEQMESDVPDWIYEGLHADFKHYVKEDDKPAFIEKLWDSYSSAYDYKSAQQAYCEAYASEVCALLKIPYLGQEMTSPRYYNFETDRIHIKLTEDTLQRWIERLQRDKELQESFAAILKDNCTSYDGFISFHSNALDDYLELPLDDWCNIKTGLLLYAILKLDCPNEVCEGHTSEMTFVDDLHESLSGNCFSSEYAANFDNILRAALADYRDENPSDDYIKPLPSDCLKGEVMQFKQLITG